MKHLFWSMFSSQYSFKSTDHCLFHSILSLLALEWQLKQAKILIWLVNFGTAGSWEFLSDLKNNKNRIYLKCILISGQKKRESVSDLSKVIS